MHYNPFLPYPHFLKFKEIFYFILLFTRKNFYFIYKKDQFKELKIFFLAQLMGHYGHRVIIPRILKRCCRAGFAARVWGAWIVWWNEVRDPPLPHVFSKIATWPCGIHGVLTQVCVGARVVKSQPAQSLLDAAGAVYVRGARNGAPSPGFQGEPRKMQL